MCQLAIEPKAAWNHSKKKGGGSEHFYEKKPHSLSKSNFLEMLIDAGAMNQEDMGEYINPTGEDLDLIEILPINDGHVCSYCQELGAFMQHHHYKQ